jgi:hypothetical protein
VRDERELCGLGTDRSTFEHTRWFYGAHAVPSYGESVSTVLARELRDLVSVHADWLSLEVQGFAEALAWPEVPLVPSSRSGGDAGCEADGGERRNAQRETAVR